MGDVVLTGAARRIERKPAFGTVTPNDVRSIGILRDLPDTEVEAIIPRMQRKAIKLRATLGVLTSIGRSVCFARSGAFRIIVSSARGVTATVHELGSGDVFGHVAAILGEDFSPALRLEASEAGELLLMSNPDFLGLLERNRGVARATTQDLAGLAKEYAGRVFDLVAFNVRVRLIGELLRLLRGGELVNGVWLVSDAPTHALLAARVGSSREVVARHLKALERDGLVHFVKRTIVYLDVARLADLHKEEAGDSFDILDIERYPRSLEGPLKGRL